MSERKELFGAVVPTDDGASLELCLVDDEGNEYELSRQVSLTWDHSYTGEYLSQVAVVFLEDLRMRVPEKVRDTILQRRGKE